MLSVIRPSVRPYINLSHCLLPFLNPWAKSNCHGTKYSYGKRTVKLINQRTKSLSKGSYLRTMGVCLKYILKNHCTGNANIQIKASMIGIDSKLFKPWAQSILGPTRSSIFNIEIKWKNGKLFYILSRWTTLTTCDKSMWACSYLLSTPYMYLYNYSQIQVTVTYFWYL